MLKMLALNVRKKMRRKTTLDMVKYDEFWL